MTTRKTTLNLLILTTATLAGAGPAAAAPPADIAGAGHQDLRVKGDANRRYFLIGPTKAATPPPGGFGLVVVLPGGHGGPGFLPFVKRIHKNALPKGYLAAQLVAVKWTPDQQIVWPTERLNVPNQTFSTEAFIADVVADVGSKVPLSDKVFSLSWSSGGTAAYAASMHPSRPVNGSFVAMSIFKPKGLPALSQARGHAYFLYHSPQDRVCPFRMAQAAAKDLPAHGAKVKLVEYPGGHGWRGAIYPRIREGVAWLEANRATYIRPGVGVGPIRFGMTQKEVIARLGKPDKIEFGQGLNYIPTRGLGMMVPPQRGVMWFRAWSRAAVAPFQRGGVTDFAGVTNKGIAMGDTRKQLLAAHGPPTRQTPGRRPALIYQREGLTFILHKDRIVQIDLDRPKGKK